MRTYKHPTPEEEWNTALHEAGHVVAAMAFGYHVASVTIEPREVEGGWFVGSISANEGKPDRAQLVTCEREDAEHFFIYSFAGVVAESLFGLHPNPHRWAHAANYEQGDIGYCRAWMEQRALGSLEEYTEEIRSRAEAFLRPRENRVRAIAQGLVRRRTMDDADLMRLIERQLLFASAVTK